MQITEAFMHDNEMLSLKIRIFSVLKASFINESIIGRNDSSKISFMTLIVDTNGWMLDVMVFST